MLANSISNNAKGFVEKSFRMFEGGILASPVLPWNVYRFWALLGMNALGHRFFSTARRLRPTVFV